MRIFLLLTAYVACEIYVFLQVWDAYGFINTFFALLFTAIIGGGLVRTQSSFVLGRLQQSMMGAPDAKVLQSALVFLGGLLLIVPGFISDAVGILLILPGSRHLIARFAREKFARAFARQAQGGAGGFRVFTFGSGFPPRPSHSESRNEAWTRDVTPKVIDIVPLKTETREVPNKFSGNDDSNN